MNYEEVTHTSMRTNSKSNLKAYKTFQSFLETGH